MKLFKVTSFCGKLPGLMAPSITFDIHAGISNNLVLNFNSMQHKIRNHYVNCLLGLPLAVIIVRMVVDIIGRNTCLLLFFCFIFLESY